MPDRNVKSERSRDLSDMARLCREASADKHLLQTTLEISDLMRQWSGALVTADRLTPDAEAIIRATESFSDALAQALLVVVENEKSQVDELARLLGLNEI